MPHQDLPKRCEEELRWDLYYRLAVVNCARPFWRGAASKTMLEISSLWKSAPAAQTRLDP
jgi:hypothetical protein